MSKVSETDNLAKVLAAMMQRDEERRVREDERRIRDEEEKARRQERWEEEQARREEERGKREERRARETREMIEALREAQPAVPQTVNIANTKLPTMIEGEDVEVYLDLFEAALTDNNIPENKWRGKMHAALDTNTKLKVKDLMRDPAVS